MPQCIVPWWDAGTAKAYRKGMKEPEEALSIIEGPDGIALAVFITGSPQKIPGLTNKSWTKLQTTPEPVPAAKKRKSDKEDVPPPKKPKVNDVI